MSELERRRQLEALFVAHAAAVRAYAARRIPAGDVDDVTSDVFVVAWRRLDDVPDDALPWLLACARRIIANRMRGTRRQAALRHRLQLERPASLGVTLSDSGLAHGLAALSPRDREALMLVAWDGLDHPRAALVVGGSLGLGTVRQAVTAIARWPGWVPVVVCGRNQQLREELAAIPGTVVLGWEPDMATLMAAADVLIENAGGLTAKEALRVGLPVVTFRPITGHGRHDASALAALGLTELVVGDESALRAAVAKLTDDTALRDERIRRGQKLFVGDAADMVVSLMPRDPVRPAS